MRLRFGMMTPTLLDLAAIVNLRPHGVAYSEVNLPKHILEPDYDKPNKNFNKWIKPNFTYVGLSSRAPIAKSAKRSNLWLRLMQTAKQWPWVPSFWPTFTDAFTRLFCPNPCHAMLQARFGFSNCGSKFTSRVRVTRSNRSPSDLSICLDHRYSGYLALDLASIPTLETKEEELELWASILISRDLPYGLALNKGNHYPCGCKVYYPAVVDVGEDGNSYDYDFKILPADDTILARPRKIPRNPLALGKESRIPIFEAEVGGQTITSEAKMVTEVIGTNPSTNLDVSMAETQQVIRPSGDHEVDDPSHIPDHQPLILLLGSCELDR
ncbi:unnamed protein product [Prunus armeniaca]